MFIDDFLIEYGKSSNENKATGFRFVIMNVIFQERLIDKILDLFADRNTRIQMIENQSDLKGMRIIEKREGVLFGCYIAFMIGL